MDAWEPHHLLWSCSATAYSVAGGSPASATGQGYRRGRLIREISAAGRSTPKPATGSTPMPWRGCRVEGRIRVVLDHQLTGFRRLAVHQGSTSRSAMSIPLETPAAVMIRRGRCSTTRWDIYSAPSEARMAWADQWVVAVSPQQTGGTQQQAPGAHRGGEQGMGGTWRIQSSIGYPAAGLGSRHRRAPAARRVWPPRRIQRHRSNRACRCRCAPLPGGGPRTPPRARHPLKHLVRSHRIQVR